MNVKKLICLVSAVAFVSTASASAQSLTDLAKQEKSRRAKAKTGTPAKVYTDANGGASTSEPTTAAVADPAAQAATGAGTTTAPAGGKKPKTPQELAAEAQAAWSEKVKKAQDEIAALEGAISQNERSLASMYNITPARADMVSRIEADKKKVADLRQQLATYEDERRRAGMPRTR